jgi:hypothetical protein
MSRRVLVSILVACVALVMGYTYNHSVSTQPVMFGVSAQAKDQKQTSGSSVLQHQNTDRIVAEQAAREKAAEVLARVTEARRRKRDRSSQEDKDRHARYRVERYEALFKSWNLSEEMTQSSLQLLAERDKKLDGIDNSHLDGKLSPYAAAAEKIKCKKDYEDHLAAVIGPDYAVQFAQWDKGSNRRSIKKPIDEE